jgi:GT2 family glycosyltransferase
MLAVLLYRNKRTNILCKNRIEIETKDDAKIIMERFVDHRTSDRLHVVLFGKIVEIPIIKVIENGEHFDLCKLVSIKIGE